MKIKNAIRKVSTHDGTIAAGAIALAATVAVNYLIARHTERHHPPQGSFVTVEGTMLHYTDRGEGTPVVLIHGNAVAGDDWDISGVTKLLLASHRVIIFDRPGCGHSERPIGKLWTATRQAEVLHKAVERLGIERPLVVGHSFGAIVAMAYAAQYQGEIAGLVLLSGYYFWTLRPDVLQAAIGAMPIVGDILRYTVSPLLGWLQMPLFKKAIFSPANVTARFNVGYSPAMALRPAQIQATAEDGAMMIPEVLELEAHYKNLTLPVTIIAGDGDKIVFKRNSERLHAVLPTSRIMIIENCGHMVHHSAPERVFDAIEATVSPDVTI